MIKLLYSPEIVRVEIVSSTSLGGLIFAKETDYTEQTLLIADKSKTSTLLRIVKSLSLSSVVTPLP